MFALFPQQGVGPGCILRWDWGVGLAAIVDLVVAAVAVALRQNRLEVEGYIAVGRA
jgi:hypothetical protein